MVIIQGIGNASFIVDGMLKTKELPARVSCLDSSLTQVDGNDLLHRLNFPEVYCKKYSKIV
jgi:hypothetical protein